MASFTRITKRKRARRHTRAGRARKLEMSRRSTASYEEVFAACGKPGEPAPRVDDEGAEKSD
jgi:hypothetical protein